MRNVSKSSHEAAPSRLKMMVFAIGLSMVIVSYQNCGKVNSDGSMNTKTASPSHVSFQFDLNTSNQLGLIKNSNDGYGPYLYNVNLSTGVVEKRYYEIDPNDPANHVLGTFCLDDITKQHLQDVVNASTVCLYEISVPEGTMCTQEYAYPHTVVQSDGSTYKLGEKSSGCPPKIYDICENKIENYRTAVDAILSEVETMGCN
jgi:hypothetical protein